VDELEVAGNSLEVLLALAMLDADLEQGVVLAGAYASAMLTQVNSWLVGK
jgi:hypothetical protein